MPDVLRVWMWACAAALLFFYVRWSRRAGKLAPPIVLLPAVTQFVWFALGWQVPAFNEFVPFFHALQYLLIAWVMQLGESLARRPPPTARRFVLGESAALGRLQHRGRHLAVLAAAPAGRAGRASPCPSPPR